MFSFNFFTGSRHPERSLLSAPLLDTPASSNTGVTSSDNRDGQQDALTLSESAQIIFETIKANNAFISIDEKIIKKISIKFDKNNWDVNIFLDGVSYILRVTNALGSDSLLCDKGSICFMGYPYKSNIDRFKQTQSEGFFSKNEVLFSN